MINSRTDYEEDLPLLANTPAQVEPLRHGLYQAAGAISLNGNVNKNESNCSKHGVFSSLSGKLQKVV